MKTEINDTQSLEEWLAIATHSLVPAARERIKLEIEAHYAEKMTGLLACGRVQSEAESQAVHTLGNPSAMAKKFRKRHLTEDDETWLHVFEQERRQQAKMLFVIVIPAALLAIGVMAWLLCSEHLIFLAWSNRIIFLGLSFILGLIVLNVRNSLLFKRGFSRVETAGKIIQNDLLTGSIAIPYAVGSMPNISIGIAALIALTALVFVIERRKIIIWRKLRFANTLRKNAIIR